MMGGTRRAVVIAILAAALAALALPAGGRPLRASYGGPAAGIGAQPLVTGLDWPAGFTFAPDGRIFYGERYTGEVRIYDPASGTNSLFFTITHLSTNGEQGLLGIALHPNYPNTPLVYAYATRNLNGDLRNQIIRIRDAGGTGTASRVIWSSDTSAGDYHDGGRILFGPDRMLYAVVGEGHDSSNSQDLSNDAGKVLRMTPAGKIPRDNPFPGSRVWTYGLRNSYGFNFDPQTGNLWETENGPECNDELNRIQKGDNYGWGPSETCSTPPPPPQNTNQDGPNPILPLWFFTPTIAPTGMAFCQGCGLSGAEGTFFFAAYNDRNVRQVVLTSDRLGIASVTIVYAHTNTPLSMERGPDGAIYFSDPSGIWVLVQT